VTKSEMKKLIKIAADEIKVANIYFRFDINYYNSFPLAFNERLFLVANEDDFILDGYSIFRFKDVSELKIKNDLCNQILKSEGLTTRISIPNVDISNWKTVFESLKTINKNIIIEKQDIDEDNREFVIGRIEKIYKNFAYVWHFDADGIWYDAIKVPFSEITNITFGSRYIEVFSKYIDEPPFIEKT
jgi:hypothetical protein